MKYKVISVAIGVILGLPVVIMLGHLAGRSLVESVTTACVSAIFSFTTCLAIAILKDKS